MPLLIIIALVRHNAPAAPNTPARNRYQINAEAMERAAEDAIFLHCLPAHRGDEVTDNVADSPRSVIFQQAENRLHAQKAVLLLTMTDL